MDQIDLKELSQRESEQVEWKENVADPDDVAKTLVAFANDWSNLGGGYVVCGAVEEKDEHGFPRIRLSGLSASRLKEVEGRVMAACRDRVSPSIAPLVHELPSASPERRILVFVMPATRQAHTFRTGESNWHYVRLSRDTREARNGILRELLVRKGEIEPWDRRVCPGAAIDDLDLLALRDVLQRIGMFQGGKGVDDYLSDRSSLSPFMPTLCVRESLTGVLRPRNFTVLLFGRGPQAFFPGAFSLFSLYPGTDRSEPHAERHELAGSLIEQVRKMIELLDVQSYVAFDKTNPSAPNAVKYPKQALHEAMVNALVHRDYELPDPTRITVFSDRIEIVSPGSLPTGIDAEEFQAGRATPKWRNQSLAWLLSKLQLAQAEGQGIPTILRSMRDEGCPPPRFDTNETRVICTLPAHPRHALARDHQRIEQMISLGENERAQEAIQRLLAQDPSNSRTLQLLAEVQRALGSSAPVRAVVTEASFRPTQLSAQALVALADVLANTGSPTKQDLALAKDLYIAASEGLTAEREVRQIALGLSRAGDDRAAVEFLDTKLRQHPEWKENPGLLRIRGNSLVGLAKACRQTAQRRELPGPTRERAWSDCRRYLEQGERDLQAALSFTTDDGVREGVRKNLDYVALLKEKATPKRSRRD